jgi:hypothetical protein
MELFPTAGTVGNSRFCNSSLKLIELLLKNKIPFTLNSSPVNVIIKNELCFRNLLM